MKIEYVNTYELKPSDFNPADRTEPRRLKALLESIKQYGILSPIQVDSKNRVADGHRRLRCAELLGVEKVPIIRCDIDVQDAWSELNAASKPITLKQWGMAYAGGLHEEAIPSTMRGKITEMSRILGDDFADIITRNSPHMFGIASKVCVYIYDVKVDEFIKQIILWIDKHKQQKIVREYMDMLVTPDVIRGAIMADKPLKKMFVIG